MIDTSDPDFETIVLSASFFYSQSQGSNTHRNGKVRGDSEGPRTVVVKLLCFN